LGKREKKGKKKEGGVSVDESHHVMAGGEAQVSAERREL
jgi:hypothetical protein